MTRFKHYTAMLIMFAVLAGPQARAKDAGAGAQWPSISLDEAQWPNIPEENLPDPKPNPNPSFVTPETALDRLMGPGGRNARADATDAFPGWPELPANDQLSPFAFEVGARYWYSWGNIGFAFANGNPNFGSPTSTLDWHDLNAHSGEIFGRVDHRPTGWFVKGLAGMGSIGSGQIEDRDFFAQQFKFSDTTSDVRNGNLSYAMIDVGWGYSPVPDIHIGWFVGYHFWRESVSAFGVRCNDTGTPINLCGPGGSVPIGFDTESLRYEPTMHAVRLGFEARFAITDRWSFSGEVAAIPYVFLQNADSHLLRQSLDDLGPAPNVITKATYAYGLEAEMFFNYALTPNIEVGAGARYWGVGSNYGGVRFGPSFGTGDPLNSFDVQRYGVLIQAKGKF